MDIAGYVCIFPYIQALRVQIVCFLFDDYFPSDQSSWASPMKLFQ